MKPNVMSIPFTSFTHNSTLVIKAVILLTVILFSLQTKAQYYPDNQISIDVKGNSAISLELGGTTFLGDLGGTRGKGKPFIKDFNSKTIRPFVGLNYVYYPKNWLSVSGGLHFTAVNGADSIIKEKVSYSLGRFDRNLSFRSFIYELEAKAEFYPVQLITKDGTAKWLPYIGTGIGLFHFNPKAPLDGKWYALHPLRLEGQGFAEYPERKKYNLTQVYLPLTVGMKYRINDNYILSLNATFRKTFTDYIDDASTTYIDPKLFDVYLSPSDASVAKQLYYRNITAPEPVNNNYRGYAGNDSYTSVFIGITYLLTDHGGTSGYRRSFGRP